MRRPRASVSRAIFCACALSAAPGAAGGGGEGGEPGDGPGALVLFVARVEDHAAVEGAKVILSRATSSGASALTDAEGRATFEGLPAGRGYRAEITSSGRPPRVVSGLTVRAAGPTSVLPIFVGPRVALEGRFVDESGRPVPGAKVRAFDDVRTKEEGPPLYDPRQDEAEEEDAALAEAVTDADGRYRIVDLPCGPVEIRAVAAGRRETRTGAFLAPDGPVGGPPTRVIRAGATVGGVVADGDGRPVAGVRVKVSSASGVSHERRSALTDDAGRWAVIVADDGPFFVDARKPGARFHVVRRFESLPTDLRVTLDARSAVALTVVDRANGHPLAGAAVTLAVRDEFEPEEPCLWSTSTSGTTDSAGRLNLPVPAGFVHEWFVSADRHVGAEIDSEWWIPQGDVDSIRAIFGRRVRAGAPLAVTVRLPPKTESAPGGIAGRVVGPSGSPVARAVVVGTTTGAVTTSTVASDAEGSFRLDGPAEEIVVRARGFVQRAQDRQVGGAAREGSPPALTLRVHRPLTIRGRVVDAEGRGVAGAHVTIVPARSNDESITTRYRGTYEALRDPWGTTAVDGTYVLRDVVPLISVPRNETDHDVEGAPPGPAPFRVVVRARGFADAITGALAYATGRTTEAGVVRLSRGARWSGRVVDGAGRPVPGARLDLDADGDETSLVDFPAGGSWRAADDGSFVVPALPPGTVKIVARADGFAPTQESRRILDDRPLPPLDIVLLPGRRLAGRVVAPSGAPIAGATVLLDWIARKPTSPGIDPVSLAGRDESYTRKQQTRTDAAGGFLLDGVPPGVLELLVSAEGWRDPRYRQAKSHVDVAVDGPPPRIVLERDPDWESSRRQSLESRLKGTRDELASVTDPDVKAAAQEEIARLEGELRDLAPKPGSR
jgi:protocatechuate 3,4-dioxygenase beta subunit